MAEIEAKFVIRKPGEVEQVLDVLADLGYSVQQQSTRTHLDTYFDTPDFSILRAGWTCRCRQRGSQRLLTLKACGTQQGPVFVREEIEQLLPRGWPAAGGRLPPGPVRDRIEAIAGRRQRQRLFAVRNRRSSYVIGTPGGNARIELDLDRAIASARRPDSRSVSRLAFTELELELLDGPAESVHRLADELYQRLHLVASQFSKFDRGLRVAGLRPSWDAEVTSAPRLRGSDPLARLLSSYLEQQLDAIHYYQPIAWEGLDPEGVHKMRVSIRRIRAILGVFGDLFDASEVRKLDTDLQNLARQLGRARDADICEKEIARFHELLPADAVAAAEPYADHLRRTTFDAYADLNKLLESRAYARLMDRLGSFVAQIDSRLAGEATGNLTIAKSVRRYVGKLAEKIVLRGDRITPESSASEIHKLRIRAKRLRYLLDLYSIVETQKWLGVIAELQKLQDLLGMHQDAVTALQHIEDYRRQLPGERAATEQLIVVGRLLQIQDSRIADCRRRLPAAWRRFKKALRQKTRAS